MNSQTEISKSQQAPKCCHQLSAIDEKLNALKLAGAQDKDASDIKVQLVEQTVTVQKRKNDSFVLFQPPRRNVLSESALYDQSSDDEMQIDPNRTDRPR